MIQMTDAAPRLDDPLAELQAQHPRWFIGWCDITEEWVALPSSTAPRRDPPWVTAADLAGLEERLARG